jgi:hypothetical protein
MHPIAILRRVWECGHNRIAYAAMSASSGKMRSYHQRLASPALNSNDPLLRGHDDDQRAASRFRLGLCRNTVANRFTAADAR